MIATEVRMGVDPTGPNAFDAYFALSEALDEIAASFPSLRAAWEAKGDEQPPAPVNQSPAATPQAPQPETIPEAKLPTAAMQIDTAPCAPVEIAPQAAPRRARAGQWLGRTLRGLRWPGHRGRQERRADDAAALDAGNGLDILNPGPVVYARQEKTPQGRRRTAGTIAGVAVALTFVGGLGFETVATAQGSSVGVSRFGDVGKLRIPTVHHAHAAPAHRNTAPRQPAPLGQFLFL